MIGCFTQLLLGCGLALFAEDVPPRAPEVEVRLEAAKQVFLLGEPVPIDVSLRNSGKTELQLVKLPVIQVGAATDLGVLVAPKNGAYVKVVPHYGVINTAVILSPIIVLSGEAITNRLQIGLRMDEASDDKRLELTFPSPGDYEVIVTYPWRAKNLAARETKSNTLSIRIQGPKGQDAEVWRRISETETLGAIHWAIHDSKRYPEFIRILSDFPATGYRSAILAYLFRFRDNKKVSQQDRKVTYSLLKLLDFDDLPKSPFVEKTVGFAVFREDSILIRDLVKRVSDSSGVKLSVSDAVATRRLETRGLFGGPLVGVMQHLQNVTQGAWMHDRDGYKLITEPPPK